MALSMQVTLRRLGQYALLWAVSRADLPWIDGEISALSWLERRYAIPDLCVILERSESSIRDRQELTHGLTPIKPADVTLVQLTIRALAASSLGRERFKHKWTVEEDAALAWLRSRHSIFDLHLILRRPMRSIEQRLHRLGL